MKRSLLYKENAGNLNLMLHRNEVKHVELLGKLLAIGLSILASIHRIYCDRKKLNKNANE